MNRIFQIICSVTFLFQSFTLQSQNAYKPIAEKGILDLSDWDFHNNGITELDGDWEFYWKKLIKPKNYKKDGETEYFNLPGLWNNRLIDSVKVSGDGYATFHLTVVLPSTEPIAFKIGRIETAYQLWINDKLIKKSWKSRNFWQRNASKMVALHR